MQSNERLLKLYESGLPAWAIYMPLYRLPYRPWMRKVTSMRCQFAANPSHTMKVTSTISYKATSGVRKSCCESMMLITFGDQDLRLSQGVTELIRLQSFHSLFLTALRLLCRRHTVFSFSYLSSPWWSATMTSSRMSHSSARYTPDL